MQTKENVFLFDTYQPEIKRKVIRDMLDTLRKKNPELTILSVVDPEVFVIGGGVSKAGQIILDYIKKYYAQYAFMTCKQAGFALAKLGNDAGIYGAAKMLL